LAKELGFWEVGLESFFPSTNSNQLFIWDGDVWIPVPVLNCIKVLETPTTSAGKISVDDVGALL
jgi:hypothetical protein